MTMPAPATPRLFPTRLGLRAARPADAPEDAPSAAQVWLLARLWVRHAELDRRLTEALRHPAPDEAALAALRRERLAVRDRIGRLSRRHRFPPEG